MKTQDARIEVRLTRDEKELIHERMKKIPTNNMSAFIRKMALNGYIVVLDLSDVKEAVRLLRINSNNLNQYAHKANATGKVYQEDIEQLKKQHEEIWEVMNSVLMRLSNI
ncbi:MAG: plasmid mobilization relaxosome protein MobC [Butyrivibrio sp.]|jgi:hypothetical protein|nr:plasmid mobilization relaxosome protein MobC [Butyrivibrio sp.]